MINTQCLSHCGEFLQKYKALICDIWGVLHDGVTAYPSTNETLKRYREEGGIVVLLSNTPQLVPEIEALLLRKKVDPAVYDSIVTSGVLTQEELDRRHYKKVFLLGPERHVTLFRDKPYQRCDLHEAEALICSGFFNDENVPPEIYQPLLDQALARRMELVCANPDVVVDVGGTLMPCAGAIAQLYENQGGEVHWAGKPHESAYRLALKQIELHAEGRIDKEQILAIGDGLRTDITGANQAGIDALFVAQGIHRDDVAPQGELVPSLVEKLLMQSQLHAKAACLGLNW